MKSFYRNPAAHRAASALLLCFLLTASHLAAQDYFWVGGPGKWSEFSTHWAKIPNPAVNTDFHPNVPTSGNDVYFTSNASPFTAYVAGTAYTLDVDAGSTVPKCRNMDWTGVPAGTVWGGGGGRMDIYGSLTMDANLSMTFNNEVHFISNDAATKQIWSKTVDFSGQVYFEGTGGGWQFMDDIFFNNSVEHTGGLIETNNHIVTVGSSFYGHNNAGILHLGTSTLKILNGWAYLWYPPAQFEGVNSKIEAHNGGGVQGAWYHPTAVTIGSFEAFHTTNLGSMQYVNSAGTARFHGPGYIRSDFWYAPPPLHHDVIFEKGARIDNANDYEALTLTAGQTYEIGQTTPSYPNMNQTIVLGGTLTALGAGTCSQFITIKSWQYGTHFNFVNNSGATQTVHCAILEDCHATGTDPLEVLDGVNLGNNTGWIFTAPNPGLDLYWVGGAGDWNDPCHWTSNPLSLVGDCTCLPNGASNVHFTANSGFSPGDKVNVPIDAYCADMDWTGVTGEPEIYHPIGGTSNLHIYGSVTLATDMDFNFGGTMRFRTSNTAAITSVSQDFDYKVIFEGTGTWELQDTFKVPNHYVFHERGTFKTLGHPMLIHTWLGNWLEDASSTRVNMGAELFLGEAGGSSSNVFLVKSTYLNVKGAFRCWYEAGNFHAEHSHIIGEKGGYIDCYPTIYHDFWDVTFEPIEHAGDFLYGNIMHKLTFLAFGNLIGPNSHIHEVEFYKGSYTFDSHTYDILTIHGGYAHKFQPYSGTGSTVQTITAGGVFNHINTSCENPTIMHNPTPGETTTFRKEGAGTAFDIQHTIFDRVYADQTSGAIYTATNCVAIQPDVELAWGMMNPTARTLHWVGGAGDWHSAAHWSLASGGAGGECPPTAHDDVFFNAASGLGAGDAVTVSQKFAFCKNMDWTGVGSGAVLDNSITTGNLFDPYALNNLSIFGSLKFSSSMTNNFIGSVWLRANGPATITSAGNHFKRDLHFWEPTGDWSLTDALIVDDYANHFYGKLTSNNHSLTVAKWLTEDPSIISASAALYLGSSTLHIVGGGGKNTDANGYFFYDAGQFHCGTSQIILGESGHPGQILAYGAPHEFYNVTFKGAHAHLHSGIILNKLIFETTGYIQAGGDVHEAEFHEDFYFYGSRNYHSIKFFPGKRYNFLAGNTQTIIPFNGIEGQFIAQGLPGQYIEMKSSNPSVPATIHMDDYNGTSTCTKYLFLTGMTHTGTEDIYVPTPGGNVFNNSGWQFFPCNPCPASIPVLDATASRTTTCVPGTAVLVLASLKPDEWANWYTDPAAMTNLVYSGGTTGPAGNRFEPSITGPATYYARVYSDGGLCESTVILSVNVTIVSPPAAFNVTGGGTVCAGGEGAPVWLSGSESGVEYQLKINGVDVGSPVAGTGMALAFGNKTAAGTYTVTARLLGTNCMVDMNGSAIVVGSDAPAPGMEPGSNGPFCEGAIDFDLILYPGTGQNVIAWQWSGPNGFTSSDQQPIIFGPTPANSGIYTLIVTGLNGCTNEATTEYVEIYPQPATQSGCDLALCEETPGSGTATFDLTEREACLTLGAGGVEVTYYTDSGLNNEIQMPTEFISGSTTVYALITEASNGCTNRAPMQLTVNALPETQSDCDLSRCETAPGSGKATFDLTERVPCLTLEAGGVAVTYFTDAALTDEIQTPDDFLSGPATVYVVVTNTSTGCTSTTTMQLTVKATPIAQSTCGQAKCEDALGSGKATFDLTESELCITAQANGVEVGYFTDAALTDEIFPPSTFLTGTTTVYTLVISNTGCNNSGTMQITVHPLPTVTCPPTPTVGINEQTFALTGATPTGGTYSGPNVTNGIFAPAAAGLGSHPVTYAYTDGNGCAGSCAFTVTVQSLAPPTIICPSNIVRNTDPGLCSAIVTYPLPMATSDVGPPILTLVSGPATASGSAFPKNTTIVNWKVTDGLNRMAVCDFTVTVKDNQPPNIVCPGNLVRNTAAGLCNAVVTYPNPTVSDNCPGVTWMRTAGPASGSTFPLGATPVTFEATDAATPVPNKKSCTFTITVNDNQPPAITCPANQTKSTTLNACTAAVTYTVTFTDNCAGGMAAIQSGIPSGQQFPAGMTNVVWKATDAAGLTKTCSFKVTVNDTQAPSITCPSSVVKNADNNLCTATTTYTTPTFTDNCMGGSVMKVSGYASGAAFPRGTNVVVWKATDAAGLTKTCSFTITVNDVQPPVATCPADVVNNTNLNHCYSVVLYPDPVATDNCSNLGAPVLLSGLASGSIFPLGTTVVVWGATDYVGLTATCSFTVTVHDAQAPTVTCPGNTTVNGTGSPCGYPSANLVAATATPDNCSIYTLTSNAPATLSAGATQIIWTATDIANNASNCMYTVTVTCGTNVESGMQNAESRAAHSVFAAPHATFQIAPNPATATVILTVTGADSSSELAVFDPLGRMVWSKQLDAATQQVTLDVSGPAFPQGMYQVRLRTADGMLTKGLVVMKL